MLKIKNRNMPTQNRQRGVVLFIALIVLVAMTLAGIALVRSVDTTNIIAGNLAFQQSATNAGDIGAERAVIWLEEQNVTPSNLHTNNLANGYAAVQGDLTKFSWDARTSSSSPNPIVPIVLGTDSAGNTVSYIIERLCLTEGDPYDTGANPKCAVPPAVASNNQGSCQTSDCTQLESSNQQYYRITSRIQGPRNTLSYTQLIIAM